MAPNIFATGTTGYVGGDVLHALLTKYPTWEPNITCLVRSETRGAQLLAAHPNINVVYGTLEDRRIIENEASKADIVLDWASSDDVEAAVAVKNGLERGRGGYWIHTSGTDILLNPRLLRGERDTESVDNSIKTYDDWENVKEVTTLPDAHSHRPCDKVPLSLSASTKIKTAIVCPPTIWGLGRGTGSTRSHQIYEIARLTLEHGHGILVHAANLQKTFWPNVYIQDLSRLYLHIIEAAVAEIDGQEASATWGQEGYYFAENGIHHWQDVADWIADEAYKQGLISDKSTRVISAGDQALRAAAGSALGNLTASCVSIRAKKLFGWQPEKHELKSEIASIVKGEAKRAGIVGKQLSVQAGYQRVTSV